MISNGICNLNNLINRFESSHPAAYRRVFYGLITVVGISILGQIGMLGNGRSIPDEDLSKNIANVLISDDAEKYIYCINFFGKIGINGCFNSIKNFDKLLNCVIISNNVSSDLIEKSKDFLLSHQHIIHTIDFLWARVGVIVAAWGALEAGIKYVHKREISQSRSVVVKSQIEHKWNKIKLAVRCIAISALLINFTNADCVYENYDKIQKTIFVRLKALEHFKLTITDNMFFCIKKRLPLVMKSMNHWIDSATTPLWNNLFANQIYNISCTS